MVEGMDRSDALCHGGLLGNRGAGTSIRQSGLWRPPQARGADVCQSASYKPQTLGIIVQSAAKDKPVTVQTKNITFSFIFPHEFPPSCQLQARIAKKFDNIVKYFGYALKSCLNYCCK
eukprot:1244170-Amphidinium_carterae.1